MRKLAATLTLLLACLWPLGAFSSDGAPSYGNPGGLVSYYDISGSTAGEEALAALYDLKELQAPQKALRKFYFSSQVGGDIPTIGADANDCLSIDTPCLTFARATVVCGGLSDCIFDAEDVWTGANVAADPANGRAMDITTSSIGGDFVSTRIRSSNPDKRVQVNCVGTDWTAGEDGIFVASSGTDWVSFEGFEVDCDPTALVPAHDQIDAFDGKQNTRILAINVGCTNVASQGDEQCFTTHGTAAANGGLFVGINTEAEVTSAGTTGNIAGSNYYSTMIFIGQGLFTETAAADDVLMLRTQTGTGNRFYVIGHNFTGTGNNDISVANLSSTACTTECNYEFARVNVSGMVDNAGTDTYLFTEAGNVGQTITLVTNQTTIANQDRGIRFNGVGGTATWNGSGVLLDGLTNYDIYIGAARSIGGAGALTGTITNSIYDLTTALPFYANAGAQATIALFNAAMDADFSFGEDAASVDGAATTLLANSTACDPAESCFDAFDGPYTIIPLFLGSGITFPSDILGASFNRFTLSGGNIGGR